MDSLLKSTSIANGVNFNAIIDSRFKTNRISINFVTVLDKRTVTANAILPFLLKKSYNGCDDFMQFNRRLQSLYGASVDGNVYKLGDYQEVSLGISCIDDRFSLDGDSITDKACEILCSMALNPALSGGVFRETEVELEKMTLVDTIESEINDKRTYALNRLVRTMCPDEPFGMPKYGYKDEAEALTPETVTTAYERLLNTARIEIMFTGCGGDDMALAVFKKVFGSIKREYTPLAPITTHAPQSGRDEVEHMAVNQSKLVMGFANGLPSDDKAVSATKLMVAAFGGTVTSKLFVNVREKLSLCYYCAARYDRFKGILTVDSGVESENIVKARKEIVRQLQSIKEGDITDEEIKNARLSLVNTLNTVYDYDFSIESWYMGQILSGTNISPKEEAAKFSEIGKADIIEAAKRFSLDTVYLLTGKDD